MKDGKFNREAVKKVLLHEKQAGKLKAEFQAMTDAEIEAWVDRRADEKERAYAQQHSGTP